MNTTRRGVYVPCKSCGKEVYRSRSHFFRVGIVFCSNYCKLKYLNVHRRSYHGKNNPHWHGGFKNVHCHACSKIVKKKPYEFSKNHKKHFCNFKCHGAWMKKYAVGKHNPSWKGGVHISKDGRKLILSRLHATIYQPRGRYIPEYRLEMEKKHGRQLGFHEVVHHINHNPTDNRIENLVVLSRSEHARIHRQK